MAAVVFRNGTSFVTNSLFRRATSFQTLSPTNARNVKHEKYPWSQMRPMQTTGFAPPSLRSQSKLSRWPLLVLLGAGGFGNFSFLGFSFGEKKENKGGDPLLRVFREAKEAQMKQEFHVAEIRYHDALKVAEEMLKLKKINNKTYVLARTNIYDSLADLALIRGELDKAEHLYKETIKLCLQQGLAKDDNAIIELSVKIASIYALMDRGQDAETGLKFCIEAQDAKLAAAKDSAAKGDAVASSKTSETAVLKKDDEKNNSADTSDSVYVDEAEKQQDTEALLGLALETYGRFLMGNRRVAEALPILERACTTAENVLGTEARQYLILLNDVATAQILLKNYDAAIGVLNKGIKLGTESSSPELPVLYCNLGAALLRMSKMDDAQAACNKGRELAISGHHPMALKMSQNCLTKLSQVKAKNA